MKWRLRRLEWIKWLIIIGLVVCLQIVKQNAVWVEKYYTYGVYPHISIVLRYLLGWLPVSIGDFFYILLVIAITYGVLKVVKLIKRGVTLSILLKGVKQLLFGALLVYVLFYSVWGLNYSRIGIAGQLHLQEKSYTVDDLDTLVNLLSTRLNNNAALLTPEIRDSFKTKKNLFRNAALLYQIAETKYPFLQYRAFSVKPSLFSYLGNYMGFQGYYNPFTGEAQVNTTVPACVEPFVVSHEIGHQLGYAKESEANFVGFLACRLHPSVNFKYSVYFDMYHYAIRELADADSVKAMAYDNILHSQVKKDWAEYVEFYKKYRNPLEPYIDKLYSYFLKANNQPKGKESYNEVVTWLIAYYKKYGKEAI